METSLDLRSACLGLWKCLDLHVNRASLYLGGIILAEDPLVGFNLDNPATNKIVSHLRAAAGRWLDYESVAPMRVPQKYFVVDNVSVELAHVDRLF